MKKKQLWLVVIILPITIFLYYIFRGENSYEHNNQKIQKLRFPFVVMRINDTYEMRNFANIKVSKKQGNKLLEYIAQGIETKGENLDVIVGIPEERYKGEFLSRLYEDISLDWYVVFNGEQFHISGWIYDKSKDVQPVISGPGWSVYVTSLGYPRLNNDIPKENGVFQKGRFEDLNVGVVAYWDGSFDFVEYASKRSDEVVKKLSKSELLKIIAKKGITEEYLDWLMRDTRDRINQLQQENPLKQSATDHNTNKDTMNTGNKQ